MPEPVEFTLEKRWADPLGERLWVLEWAVRGHGRRLLFASAKQAARHAEWEARTAGGRIVATTVEGERRVKVFEPVEAAGDGLRFGG